MNGRNVTTLVDEAAVPAGIHDFRWDCPDDLRPGVYFYTLTAGQTLINGKMIKIE
jgi:hypothetical protein